MAKGFNLTAELNIRGPSNIRAVISDIKRQVGTVSVNIIPTLNRASVRTITNDIRRQIGNLSAEINIRPNTSSVRNLARDIRRQLGTITADVQVRADSSSIRRSVSNIRSQFRNISASISVTASPSSVRQASSAIRRQLGNINTSVRVNVSAASVRQAAANIRRQLGSINANINVGINAASLRGIGAYTTNLARLNATLAQTTATATNAAGAIATLTAAMGAAGRVNLGQINVNLGNAGNAARNAANNIQLAGNEVENFGRQAGLAIRRFAAFSVVTGVVFSIASAFKNGISAFIEYDQQLTRISQVTGDTKESLGKINSTISELSTSLGVSSKELATTSVTLAQAGLTARDTETALKALALSALAPSFDDMNQTVEGSIALMRQFSISSKELEGSLGSINAVAAKFAVEASDIIIAIQRTGGVFAAAGKGVSEGTNALNEFIAVFTSIRATTRESAETIATGLRTIFTRIQRADTIEALKEFGVTLTDLEGKFVGPYIAVQRLSEGLSKLDPRDLSFSRIVEELGGFRQIGKVLPLIQQFGTAQEALKVAQQGQGSLAGDAAKGQMALAIQISKVKEEFLALVRSVGNTDSFQNMIKVGLDLASALIKVADAAKGLIPLVGLFAAFRGAQAITQFAGGFGRGFRGAPTGQRAAEGGPIRHFASGGYVPGFGNGDTVSAKLTPGEFVMRKSAVQSIGVGNLHSLNRSSGGTIPSINRYSSGTENSGGVKQFKDTSIYTKGKKKTAFAHLDEQIPIGKSASKAMRLQGNWVGLTNVGLDLPASWNLDWSKPRNYRGVPAKKLAKYIKNNDVFKSLLTQGGKIYGKFSGGAKSPALAILKNSALDIRQKLSELLETNPIPPRKEMIKDKEVQLPAGWYDTDPDIISRPKTLFFQAINSVLGPGSKAERQLRTGLKETRAFRNKTTQEEGIATVNGKEVNYGRTIKFSADKKRALGSRKVTRSFGGPIQRFMAGDLVEPPAATTAKSSAGDIIKLLGVQRAAAVGGISSADVYTTLNKRTPTPQQAASKAAILAEFTKQKATLASKAEASQTRKQKRATAKGLVFGAAGLFGTPFATNPLVTTIQDARLKDPNKQHPVSIYSGIYKNQKEASRIDTGFDKDISKSSDRAAKKIKKQEMSDQKRKVGTMLGGFESGRELALDFDRTLAFGADKILADPKQPRFSEFSNTTKVSEALAKAKLSILGSQLVSLVGQKPELLKNIRIITARPKATLPLIQGWLTSKGLPIQAGQFKGFGGPTVSGSDIAKLKAAALTPGSIFIDDDKRNVSAARKRADEGIDTYRYRGVKKLKENTQPLEEAEAVKGGLLEGLIRRLGAAGSKKGNGFDFMTGLGPVARKFQPRIPSNIPTDIKRTIVGLSTIKDNIVTYLKNVKGYALGGSVQGLKSGGFAKQGWARGMYSPEDILAHNKKYRTNLTVAQLEKRVPDSLNNDYEIDIPRMLQPSRVPLSDANKGAAEGAAKRAVAIEELARTGKAKFKIGEFEGRGFKDSNRETRRSFGGAIQRFPQGGTPSPAPTPRLIQRGGFKYELDKVIAAGFTEAQFMKQIPVPGGYGEQWQIGGMGEGSIPMPPSLQPYKARPSVVQDRVNLAQSAAQNRMSDAVMRDGRTLRDHETSSDQKAFKKMRGYAAGGHSADMVPALVSKGEAFVPPETAKSIGLGKLREMNNADRNGMSSFASGGVSVFKGPGTGTSDSIGPVSLPVGSFIIRAAATKSLGLRNGGPVGNVQEFATGGAVQRLFVGGLLNPPPAARPNLGGMNDSEARRVVGVVNSVNQQLGQLATVLQELGVTSGDTARLMQRGSQATYAQAIQATEADIRRARVAGASAQQIAAAESVLRDIRQQADRDIRARRASVDTPGGARASLGSLGGQDLQRIDSRADQLRQQMTETERNRLASQTVTRRGATVRRYSDEQVEERLQRRAGRFNRQSYEQATTQVTGGRVNLGAVGLTGDDAQRHIQQSMRDRNTLAQMDRAYIPRRAAQIRQQLEAERGVTVTARERAALGRQATRMAEQEARDRANTVRASARAAGAAGPGGGAEGGMARGMGMAFGLQMMGSLLAQQINPESSSSNAQLSAGLQGGTNMLSTGAMIGSGVMEMFPAMSRLLGPIAILTTAALAAGQALIDARNAAIEFEKKLADKRVQDAMERVGQGFDKLSKNIKDIKIQDDITRNLIEASKNVRQSVEADKTTAKAFWANIGDVFMSTAPTGISSQQAAASRSKILEKQGVGAYLGTTSIGQYLNGAGSQSQQKAETRRSTLVKGMIPETAKEESKKYVEVAQGMQRIIEDKLRSGLSVKELLTAPKHEFEKIAKTIAMADQATNAQILAIQADTTASSVEKEERIKNISALYAEDKVRKSAKAVDMEKASKNFDKNINNMSRSLERMFQNMDQAIEKTSFSLKQMSQDMDLLSASLSGQAKTGDTSLKSMNVLQNPRAYGGLEKNSARDQGASFFTGERNLVKGLLSIGDNLETGIMSSINKTLTDNPAASNEQIGINIEKQVTKQIAKLQLPPDVGNKLGEQVKTALDEMRKSGDDNLNFDDLMEKIPALSKVLESGKRAQESALKALEHWQSSLNSYSEKINQLIDLQIDTNEKLRRSSELVINGNMEVSRALGKDVSVSSVRSARNVGIAQRTGGLTDADAISKNIMGLESRRRSLESSANSAGNRGLAGGNDFVKFKSGLLDTNVALRENIAALKSLAENGDVASAALGKIQESQQKQAGKVGFLEKLVTSTPEEVDSLGRAMSRLQNNINGQLNTINNSVGAQKAYNDAIEQGASTAEAMSSAQVAFANERKETLGALNDLLPFLNNNQQGNNIKANVLEGMARESGVGFNPMIQEVINSLRNPQADPQTQAAMQQYQAAINEQVKANGLLAQLNDSLAKDIATQSALALSKALTGASITFKNSQLDDIANNVRSIALRGGDQPVPAVGKANGGMIYAAAGTMVNFQPKGTDTVPAMLTPGEFVVNRSATSRNLPLLQSINSGGYSKGGSVNYYSSGGYVSSVFKSEYLDSKNLENSEKQYIDPEDKTIKDIISGDDKPAKIAGGWKQFTRLQSPSGKYHSAQYKKSFLERTGVLPEIRYWTGGSPASETNDSIPFDTNGKLVPGAAPTITADPIGGEYAYKNIPPFNVDDPMKGGGLGYLLSDRKFNTKNIAKNDLSKYRDIINQLINVVPLANIWGMNSSAFDVGSVDDLTGGSGGLPYNPNLTSSKPIGLIMSRGDSKFGKLPIEGTEGIQKIFSSTRTFTGQTGDTATKDRIYGAIKGTASAGNLPDPMADIPGNRHVGVVSDNDRLKWITDKKEISGLRDIQKENIELVKNTTTDVLGGRISWLKNTQKNDKLISLQQKLQKIYEGGSLIEDLNISERELIDHTQLRLDDTSGKFSLLSRQLEPQLAKRVAELSTRPKDQQLPQDRDNARIATLTRIGGAASWADGDPFPINFSENGLTKPMVSFPWIANVDPEFFLQNIKEQQDQQAKDRASGKDYGFDISSLGLQNYAAKLPAPLDKVSFNYKAAYTKYKGRMFNLRQKELDNTRPINDAFIIDPKHDDALNIFKNANSPDKSFFTGFPGPYQSQDLAKRISVKDPQSILDYMQALRNNDPNADTLGAKINGVSLALGPSLLRVMNDKPLYLPDDLYYGVDNNLQNIDISPFVLASAKEAAGQLKGLAGEKSGKINTPGSKTQTISEADLGPTVQKIAQASLGIFGRRPGIPSGYLYSQFGRALSNISDPIKAKNTASGISGVFGNLVKQINTMAPRNPKEFEALRDSNILATGASAVFNKLASGSTNYIKSFLGGGSSIENLFRSLGSGSFFSEMGSQQFSEDFTNQLGADLKGSKLAKIGADGSISLTEMNEQDVPKNYQGLVDLAINPYHEFGNRSVRQGIFQKLMTDIPNFRASHDVKDPKTGNVIERRKTQLPLFGPSALKMIMTNLNNLSQWYGGNGAWAGQDYLNENDPATTPNERAEFLASNFDGALYTTASEAHRQLGGLANFGDIPNREWLMARGQAKMPDMKPAVKLATGGMVYASNGQYVNYQPRGTDTVPAMLTPGEFVVNRSATQQNLPLLRAINSGADAYSSGGVVYAAGGTPDPVQNNSGSMWQTLGGGAAAGWAGTNMNRIGSGIYRAATSPIGMGGLRSAAGSVASGLGRTFPWTTAALRGAGSLGVNATRMGLRGVGNFLGVGNIIKAFSSAADVPALQAAYQQTGQRWGNLNASWNNPAGRQFMLQQGARAGLGQSSVARQVAQSGASFNQARQALNAGVKANSLSARAARGLPLVGKAAGRLVGGIGFGIGAYEGYNADTSKTGRSRLTNTLLGAATGSGTTMGDVGATSITGTQFGGNLIQAGLTTAQYAGMGVPLPIAAALAAGTMTAQEVTGLMGDRANNAQAEARMNRTANMAYSGDERHLSGLTGVEVSYIRQIINLEKALAKETVGTKRYDQLQQNLNDAKSRNITEKTRGILFGTTTTTSRKAGLSSGDDTLDKAIDQHRQYEVRLEAQRVAQAAAEKAEEARLKAQQQQAEAQNRTRAAVTVVSNVGQAAYNFGVSMFNKFKEDRKNAINADRSKRTAAASQYLDKPAVPDLIKDSQTFRDERQAAIDEVRRLDGVYQQESQLNKNRGDSEAELKRLKDAYDKEREAALAAVAKVDSKIIDRNKEAEKLSPDERQAAWKSYNDNQAKTAKDEALAQARYQSRVAKTQLKKQADGQLAIAEITRVPRPTKDMNPESFFRWSENARKTLNRKFKLSGNDEKDMAILSAAGLSPEIAKQVIQPISKENSSLLLEMMSTSGKYSKQELGLLQLSGDQIEQLTKASSGMGGSATAQVTLDERNKVLKKQRGLAVKTQKQLSRIEKQIEAAERLGPEGRIRRQSAIQQQLLKQGLVSASQDGPANQARLEQLGMKKERVGFIFQSQVPQQAAPANGMSSGGVVYAAGGTLIPYSPRGTDTVPAMLTPGEFVVNSKATSQNLPLLQSINRSKGGSVAYYADGGLADAAFSSNNTKQSGEMRNNQSSLELAKQNFAATNENKKISQDTQKLAQTTAKQIPIIQNQNASSFEKAAKLNSNTNASVKGLEKRIDNFGNFMGFSSGGMVYASNGMMIPYEPRGTDTVPAMLTPGEFVVNRAATQANLPLLQSINQSKGGSIKGFADGGVVYAQDGRLMPGLGQYLQPNNQTMPEMVPTQGEIDFAQQQAQKQKITTDNSGAQWHTSRGEISAYGPPPGPGLLGEPFYPRFEAGLQMLTDIGQASMSAWAIIGARGKKSASRKLPSSVKPAPKQGINSLVQQKLDLLTISKNKINTEIVATNEKIKEAISIKKTLLGSAKESDLLENVSSGDTFGTKFSFSDIRGVLLRENKDLLVKDFTKTTGIRLQSDEESSLRSDDKFLTYIKSAMLEPLCRTPEELLARQARGLITGATTSGGQLTLADISKFATTPDMVSNLDKQIRAANGNAYMVMGSGGTINTGRSFGNLTEMTALFEALKTGNLDSLSSFDPKLRASLEKTILFAKIQTEEARAKELKDKVRQLEQEASTIDLEINKGQKLLNPQPEQSSIAEPNTSPSQDLPPPVPPQLRAGPPPLPREFLPPPPPSSRRGPPPLPPQYRTMGGVVYASGGGEMTKIPEPPIAMPFGFGAQNGFAVPLDKTKAIQAHQQSEKYPDPFTPEADRAWRQFDLSPVESMADDAHEFLQEKLGGNKQIPLNGPPMPFGVGPRARHMDNTVAGQLQGLYYSLMPDNTKGGQGLENYLDQYKDHFAPNAPYGAQPMFPNKDSLMPQAKAMGGVVYAQDGFDPSRPLNPMMNRQGKGSASTLTSSPISNFDNERLAEEAKAAGYGAVKSVLPGLAGLGAGVLGFPTTGPGGFAIGLGAGAAVYQAQENYLNAFAPQTNKNMKDTTEEHWQASLLGSMLGGFGTDKIGRNVLSSSMKNTIRMPSLLPNSNASVRPDMKSASQEAMEEFSLRSKPGIQAPSLLNESKPEGLLGSILHDFKQKAQSYTGSKMPGATTKSSFTLYHGGPSGLSGKTVEAGKRYQVGGVPGAYATENTKVAKGYALERAGGISHYEISFPGKPSDYASTASKIKDLSPAHLKALEIISKRTNTQINPDQTLMSFMDSAMGSLKKSIDTKGYTSEQFGKLQQSLFEPFSDVGIPGFKTNSENYALLPNSIGGTKFQNEQILRSGSFIPRVAAPPPPPAPSKLPVNKNKGGIIYASTGTLVNYQPRGTDTVPAMLTPGEFVVNRASTEKHLPLLRAINSGHYAVGGRVSPAQLALNRRNYLDRKEAEKNQKDADKKAREDNFAAARQQQIEDRRARSISGMSVQTRGGSYTQPAMSSSQAQPSQSQQTTQSTISQAIINVAQAVINIANATSSGSSNNSQTGTPSYMTSSISGPRTQRAQDFFEARRINRHSREQEQHETTLYRRRNRSPEDRVAYNTALASRNTPVAANNQNPQVQNNMFSNLLQAIQSMFGSAQTATTGGQNQQTGTPRYLTSSINTTGVQNTQDFFEKRRINQQAQDAERTRRTERAITQPANNPVVPGQNPGPAAQPNNNIWITLNNNASRFGSALNIATVALGQFNQQLAAGMTQNSVSNNGSSGSSSLDGISQFTQTFQSFIDQLKNINPVINMTGTHTVVVEFGASAGVFRNMEAGVQDFVTNKINEALGNLSRGTENAIPTYQV